MEEIKSVESLWACEDWFKKQKVTVKMRKATLCESPKSLLRSGQRTKHADIEQNT